MKKRKELIMVNKKIIVGLIMLLIPSVISTRGGGGFHGGGGHGGGGHGFHGGGGRGYHGGGGYGRGGYGRGGYGWGGYGLGLGVGLGYGYPGYYDGYYDPYPATYVEEEPVYVEPASAPDEQPIMPVSGSAIPVRSEYEQRNQRNR